MPCLHKVKCAVCHTECETEYLFIRNLVLHLIDVIDAEGTEDTDPDDLAGGEFWQSNPISVCPHCGYVAPDLSEAPSYPAAIEILKTDAYKNADNIAFKNKLAKLYYQRSMLVASDPIAKCQNLLFAAWACHYKCVDEKNAVLMRRKALVPLDEIIAKRIGFENHYPVEDHLAGLMLIKLDLLRRAALFQEFEEEYEKLLEHPLAARDDNHVKDIYWFIDCMHTLNAEKDTGCKIFIDSFKHTFRF